ncbi:MAG: ribonuclease HII [bacterium]|nr:ribonuclease HII [bacterium]
MKSIKEIDMQFRSASPEELPGLIAEYGEDTRAGVRKLAEAAEKRMSALEREKERIERLRFYEEKYREYDYICGIDEVGRGPLAGPVAAGAVILPRDCRILYINDSKQLSEKKREELCEIIKEKAVAYAVGYASPERIDEINILQATYEAMRQAVGALSPQPDLLLNDAVTIPGIGIRQIPIIKGDAKSITIGAASILAKVARDRLMKEYDRLFPEYDFAGNKGYGSAAHIAALKKYGPTPIHRRSFIGNFQMDDAIG